MLRYLLTAAAITFALVNVVGRAPALAGSWHLDVRNKSDKCVLFTVHHTRPDAYGTAYLLYKFVKNIPPGKELNIERTTYGAVTGFAFAEFYATAACQGAVIERRDDRFPSSGNWELSMHGGPNGPGSSYIMRHGP